MAEIFLARQEGLEGFEKTICIKRIRPHLSSQVSFVRMFLNEAKLAAQLNHPNIVQIYDLGRIGESYFIAMEYIHGKSIDQIFQRLKSRGINGLPLELASYITMEIIRALAFAHDLKDSKDRDLNIIHRDISPGNLLISYQGDVKLSDFGISAAEHRLQPFLGGNSMGKLNYIPPEQAINDPAQRASDLYSLSVVYFQMLTGILPFNFKSVDDLVRGPVEFSILNDHLKDRAPNIPVPLREFLSKCLNRSPKNRPQSASEYFHTLKEILQGELEVDYFARATRQYFKKRLTEFLKEYFQNDEDREKKILYNALNPVAEVASTESADIENAPVFNVATEATLIVDDLGSEQTVISKEPSEIDGQPFQQLNTVVDFQQVKTRDSSLGIEDKIRISSLSKDQRENLKDTKPSIEIHSEEEQDAFDGKTLGADPAHPIKKNNENPAKPLFEKNTKPAAINTPTQPDFKLPAVFSGKAKKYLTLSISFISRGFIKAWIPIVAFVVACSLWFLLTTKADRPAAQLLPVSNLTILATGEASIDEMARIIALLKMSEKTDSNLSPIENFFNQEYFKYTKSFQKVLQMKWEDPISIRKKLSLAPNIQELLRSGKIFKFITENGGPKIDTESPAILIYFLPANIDSSSQPRLRSSATTMRAARALFIPANPAYLNQAKIEIAQEIAQIYGASLKIDPNTNMPQYPDGYANPESQPLYPQTAAELLGGFIPTSAVQTKTPQAFSDFIIGPKTAHELGWKSD
jgi:serine/threonine-protein kinase